MSEPLRRLRFEPVERRQLLLLNDFGALALVEPLEPIPDCISSAEAAGAIDELLRRFAASDEERM